jgi:phage shock protein A
MALFDRLSRVVRANLNDMVAQAEDPEEALERALINMKEASMQLRQAVARAVLEQKRTEQKYNQDLAEASKWEQRAKLAIAKGDENLAREALIRKQAYIDTATVLKQQLEQQTNQVNTLRQNLDLSESKIAEAKTKKNLLLARARATKANEQLQKNLSNIDVNITTCFFERMETKVLEMEARSIAIGELGGFSIEQQFAQLEAGSDVDEELAIMKAMMLEGSNKTQYLLPEASETSSYSDSHSIVDAELEELRAKLKDV